MRWRCAYAVCIFRVGAKGAEKCAAFDHYCRVCYVPARGDAIWINLHPQAVHEQAGRRPAMVLSPSAYNGRVGFALLCPITNQRKGYPFEVRIPSRLRVTGVVLADQIKSLDWRVRQAEFICALPAQTVAEVLAKLATLLSGPV